MGLPGASGNRTPARAAEPSATGFIIGWRRGGAREGALPAGADGDRAGLRGKAGRRRAPRRRCASRETYRSCAECYSCGGRVLQVRMRKWTIAAPAEDEEWMREGGAVCESPHPSTATRSTPSPACGRGALHRCCGYSPSPAMRERVSTAQRSTGEGAGRLRRPATAANEGPPAHFPEETA